MSRIEKGHNPPKMPSKMLSALEIPSQIPMRANSKNRSANKTKRYLRSKKPQSSERTLYTTPLTELPTSSLQLITNPFPAALIA